MGVNERKILSCCALRPKDQKLKSLRLKCEQTLKEKSFSYILMYNLLLKTQKCRSTEEYFVDVLPVKLILLTLAVIEDFSQSAVSMCACAPACHSALMDETCESMKFI